MSDLPRRELLVAPRAEADIADAAAWYEAQRIGLSVEFIHALDRVFDDIVDRPTTFRTIRGHVRRALLRRFPYGVFFIETGSTIAILAVVHARRHPRVWPSRPAR